MVMARFLTLPAQVEIFTLSAFEPPAHNRLDFAVTALDFGVGNGGLEIVDEVGVVEEVESELFFELGRRVE